MKLSTKPRVGTLLVTACLVIIIGVALIGTGSVVAQDGLDVSIDVPQEATAGEQTTLSSSVSIPEAPGPGGAEADLTVTFYSNGEQIGSETVTVSGGETTSVDLAHTFESGGDKDIRVEASTTIGGQELTGSQTTTISVSEPEVDPSIDGNLGLTVENPDSPQVGEDATVTVNNNIPSLTGADNGELTLRLLVDGEEVASETVTVNGGDATETDLTTVFESSGETDITVEATLTVGDQSVTESVTRTVTVAEAPVDTTAVEGAAFTVPDTLEDEVQAYRDAASQEIGANAFVLATQDELYVVFTQEEPTKGVATVEGPVLDRELATTNLTYGVIAATSASFETTGTEASVQEVAENSDEYRLDLVRVNAHYRRVSTLTDPDTGEGFTLATTAGVLIENPQTAESLLENSGGKARTLGYNYTTDDVDSVLQNPRGPHLHTFSFETAFWADADATVDAIVLDPQSAAQQFIDEYDDAAVAHAEDGAPILYVVEEDFDPQQVEDVSTLKSEADSLDGEVVETEVRLYQERVSVQETLEHNTGCDADLLEIQTPQGPVCVNVVQDTLLHGGVAWNSIPQSRDDALLVMGASSRHQDSPEEFVEGRYRIEGEVVSTARLNESLPDGSVMIIYEMEREDSIDYEAVAEEARSLIEARTDTLGSRLREQIGGDDIEIVTGRASETIQTATPGEPATVTFSGAGSQSISVQQARLNVSSEVQNVQMDVSSVASLPSNVEQPPGQSLRLLNISTTVADDTIEDASFQLRISKAALPDGTDVTVYRYHDGGWTELDMAVVEETDSTLTVDVTTTGFSYFAVSSQPTGDESSDTGDGDDSTSTEDDEDSSPDENQGETNAEGEDGTAGAQNQEDTTADGSEGDGGSTDAEGPGFTLLTVVVALGLIVGKKVRN